MRSRRFRRLRAQGKELLDERGAALGGLLNLPSLFQGRAVFLEAHHEKIGAAEDCGDENRERRHWPGWVRGYNMQLSIGLLGCRQWWLGRFPNLCSALEWSIMVNC